MSTQPETSEDFIARALEHVRYLSLQIGPRPSAGEAEREAAEYCARIMQNAGMRDVRIEAFPSGLSTYRPFTLAIAAGLLGNLLRVAHPGRSAGVLSALLNGLGAHGFWAEANFDNNWMRRVLCQGTGHNAIGVVPSRKDTRQRIVLVGHIDTHRTPIVYSSSRWLKSFSTLVGLAFVSLAASSVLGVLSTGRSTPVPKRSRLDYVFGVASVFQAIALGLTLQAEATPHAHGANDNASGAATVLALGERLTAEPLRHTEVWIVNNGCEELGAYGMAALIEAHTGVLRDAFFLDFDMVGVGEPKLLTREGLVRSYFPDETLLEMARDVAKQHPGVLGGEHSGGAYTDIGPVIKHGMRGLVIDSQVPPDHPAQGRMGYWHQKEDTFDKIEPQCLERTQRFGWALLQHIDSAAVQ